MFMKRLIWLGCLLTAPFVYADDEDDLIALYDEEELISIATGTEKQIRFAPSVATVITRAEIEQVGARTLDEALEMVPGLHVARSFNRQDPIYSFRGIHTGTNPQVLLLVDGIRVQQIFSGARPYNYELSTANIERIEIIRGPGSALYGADAFAGVISVTTRSAAGVEGTTLGGRAGSFDTQEVWVSSHENWAGIAVDFSLEYKKTEGDNGRIIQDDFQTNPVLQGAFLGGGPSLAPGKLNMESEAFNGRVKFSTGNWYANLYSWNLANAGNGSGGFQALDPEGYDKGDVYGLQLGLNDTAINEDLRYSARLSHQILNARAHFKLLPDGSDFLGVTFPAGVVGNPGVKETTYSGDTVIDFTGIKHHDFRIGLGFNRTELKASESKNFVVGPDFGNLIDVAGTSDIYIQNRNREHYFAYIQDEWELADDWQATLGVRYDTYTQFGDSINPRAALVWATTHKLTTKFLYGRAFRAPSFGELFSDNNEALKGNPDLDPETIDTYEIAFDYAVSPSTRLRLNLFHYDIDDLISVVFGVDATNTAGQKGEGFEFEIESALTESFSINASYAFFDAEEKETQNDVANAPTRQAYLTGIWHINDVRSLAMTINHVAGRERTPLDPRSDIDDYTVVDAVFHSATPFRNLEYSVIARNLFDKDAREPSTPGIVPTIPEIPDDYPEEGRSLTLELVYHLD